MSRRIIIDPLTRISGFLEIQVEAEENIVTNAIAASLLFRGFEKMLRGRTPLDAVYFTERICGICSTAHSMASTMALESALGLTPGENDSYMRDIIHGFEFMQNHLRHFYQLNLPSYAKITAIGLVNDQNYEDFRLPADLNQRLEEHYIESLRYSRMAHEGIAVLGGKAPHNHGIFPGGVTTIIDAYKLEKVKSIIRQIRDFAYGAMEEDMEILAEYYSDYFTKGMSYANYMSYGLFDKYDSPDLTYVEPGVMVDGIRYPFQADLITEHDRYSYYGSDEQEVDTSKADAYTFVKAPRYNGCPMEVGPLARMILSGEYAGGNSCMDRVYARVTETQKIITILGNMADLVELKPNNQQVYLMPQEAKGMGLVDTTRGALGHWLEIENQVIGHYNIITPSGWNLSPRGDDDIPGPVENSLIGTILDNMDAPVEIGRIVRSFDPCVSCATHFYGGQGRQERKEIVI